MTEGMPPHDVAAEQAVLGAVLRIAQDDTTSAIDVLASTPHPDDYYRPAHETIAYHLAKAAANGGHLDPASILGRLTDAGELQRIGGGPYLHTLIERAAPIGSVDHLATRVQRLARQRRAQQAVHHAAQRLYDPAEDEILDALVDAMDALEGAVQQEVHGTRADTLTVENIDQVLTGVDDDDEYDWVIPQLLERQDRLIVTGPEGGGKSTLLQQIAIQAAMGRHPFTGEAHPPLRVLYVDCENTRRQFRRKTRALRTQAGRFLDPERLQLSFRTEGLDLTQANDVDWLERHVAATKPDLLITGPIYKLANGDPTEEKSAKPVAMALDKIRAHYGCAVILEAHAPKALGGAKRRAHEPYGWSGWLRWPEFGIWLGKEGSVEHWRGMRDDKREWPELLQRGGSWPWTVPASESATRWARMKEAMLAADRVLTVRELADQTSIPKTTVARVLGEYGMQFEALKTQLGGDHDEA